MRVLFNELAVDAEAGLGARLYFAVLCLFVGRIDFLPLSMSQKDIIQGMKEIASAVLPAGAEALLFGSRARGDARPDSDWDVLILIDGERATGADFDKYAYPFVNYGWTVGEQINPLIYTFSDWNNRRISPFYKNVQTEGVSLCH